MPSFLRLAHLTDVHVQLERGADDGLRQALQHMQGLDPAPQLLLNGGDAVMNATDAPPPRIDAQWAVWHEAFKSDGFAAVRHCLGNHDVISWASEDPAAQEHKRRAVTELSMPERYYSFDMEGWHFVVLDSCQPLDGGYTARLDEAQYRWLAADLEATPAAQPVLVLSHVPILTVTGHIYDDQRVRDHHWHIPGDWVHTDAFRLQDLFTRHPNVRLCLSGHIHLRDRCQYNGVTYICGGALCAGWWGGDLQQCDEGYGVVDLYADGSFDYQYLAFDWQVRPA